jgi:excisionase family DNA binding protein
MIGTTELAKRLNTSRLQIRRLAARGKIPYIRIGTDSEKGHMRFDFNRVVAALSALEIQADSGEGA